ncbi:PTS mannitol transporter subunit IICBA [Nocardioides sp. HM23]|uniref:PTS mannitol transporter subunit IICBA n=1 Tax=Nocardioides bizhenqiangii TaxID=3095076 RepID=UPI002ACA02E4|nr:PTS mannitol transporter subunit IICBA [Nocardioides sp. HM23]MDZ5622765.1 PTS mannitol transporter subunit IICBA [Nocardioides sp. HM23]
MAATATATPGPKTGVRVHVQRFGTFLSNMIMPNIAAIIAWGLITAFFIPDGFTPNEKIATMVGPTIYYLLPILIAYTGGRIVHGTRGGVVGAMSVMGVIMATSDVLFVGADGGSPMFLGAMIMGPLTAWVVKQLDSLWEGKIKPGFEMLVDNFSAGIAAAAMAIGGMFLLAPVLRKVITWLGDGVDFLVDNDVLPFTSIVIEPAKVMFLNNAINHGVLTPLGIDEAAEQGKSILFLLEANPGPGLGLLLAYTFFGRGLARAAAPGAAIIQFFGGIHEVYFPFVLMKPKMILAPIAGGITGIFLLTIFDAGLRAPAAPGSIFAVYAQTPGDAGDYLGVTLGVFGAAAVSFVVAALLLKTDRSTDEGDLDHATAAMEQMKGKRSIASSMLASRDGEQIRSVVFACDAGMGSSAMGASVLRKKIHDAGHPEVTVVNMAIANLTDSFDLVVTHQDLTDRARLKTPSAIHVSVENFMGSPRYDEIVDLIDQTGAPSGTSATADPVTAGAAGDVLTRDSIVLGGTARSRDEAITEAGRLLVESGAVDASYVDAMQARESSVSTHMGNGLAIPHGTNEAKGAIRRTAISFVRYDEPIDWNGKPAEFVLGIAGAGNDHLALLSRIAEVFTDDQAVARLRAARTPEDVLATLDTVRV